MPRIATFGYGSLVNAATRDEGSHALRARLHGWRRVWRIAGETPQGDRAR